jgi:hypothetical protein
MGDMSGSTGAMSAAPRAVITAYGDIGPNPRYSVAMEIYLIRPRRELQGLLDLLAHALAQVLVT